MSHVSGGQQQAKKPAGRDKDSDVRELQDNIADLGNSVSDMATLQYDRAQDMATDAIEETSQSIRRNPLTAIGVGLGVGFLLGLVLTGGRSVQAR
jgi:ElaB/YqjD/DUF883 family membrane-anchored ribosome-binding protein